MSLVHLHSGHLDRVPFSFVRFAPCWELSGLHCDEDRDNSFLQPGAARNNKPNSVMTVGTLTTKTSSKAWTWRTELQEVHRQGIQEVLRQSAERQLLRTGVVRFVRSKPFDCAFCRGQREVTVQGLRCRRQHAHSALPFQRPDEGNQDVPRLTATYVALADSRQYRFHSQISTWTIWTCRNSLCPRHARSNPLSSTRPLVSRRTPFKYPVGKTWKLKSTWEHSRNKAQDHWQRLVLKELGHTSKLVTDLTQSWHLNSHIRQSVPGTAARTLRKYFQHWTFWFKSTLECGIHPGQPSLLDTADYLREVVSRARQDRSCEKSSPISCVIQSLKFVVQNALKGSIFFFENMTQRIEPSFSRCLNDLNPFFWSLKNWTLFWTRTQRIDFFTQKLTQRMEPLF